ncbi:2-oxogluturate dehydrogenase complex E2 component [Candidatus Protochlamydia naegleriophila]|uniref:Dihydrolipoyllysine-residue succinyltransferase n=1 Tax=Candidatus Protochlamydia naegleriophila TaxID=389348 RepID=A0A0U5EQR9_9BACT|nr:2-oxoglutarate dehydrogenase complex dihydrolipoyllysine-residue succinyltransferase [Candidatus Protochlamydia naegleriophila]CUI16417.1 2-oxogluturate dehydrogenase complex E2 component [Candidatus Protochlamydia naegleriophila]
MKSEIKVPAMGESIAEAVIGQILSPEGSIVKADAEILELETDKVNQVLYAPRAGKVFLSVKLGETVKIGQVIGFVEESSAVQAEVAKSSPVARQEAPSSDSAKQQASIVPVQLASAKSETDDPSLRWTKESFLSELQALQGAAPKQIPSATGPVTSPASKSAAGKEETRKPMSKIRRVIASRLVEAQQTMAMLTTFNEVDLSEVIALREKHKELFIKKYGTKLGFMSFFVKAAVSALQAYPNVNSYLDGEDIVQRHYYDIGIAVGTDRGTLVPVVRGCDRLSFAQIELAIDEFAKKSRDGKVAADDLQGGGFTITNGGVYGSLLSTPILNPPQCGILGMHKIEKRAVVVNDQIVIRPMMYLALSYDHRLIDGKESVAFLVHIKNALEDPSRLLLDL